MIALSERYGLKEQAIILINSCTAHARLGS